MILSVVICELAAWSRFRRHQSSIAPSSGIFVIARGEGEWLRSPPQDCGPSSTKAFMQALRLCCDTIGHSRRYVQPNQCFKPIIAFVTHPGMTNVIVLEKFGICRCAQEFATFWTGAPREMRLINAARGRSDAARHVET